MDKQEYDLLIEGIKKILQNKPYKESDIIRQADEIDRVQEALVYLSTCLVELNEFSQTLCRGDLDAPLPGRHNYLVGGLKELHAVLKHLTWQTKQVANGDYKQRINFLGDFSESFNRMVEQLEEREQKLKESAMELEESMIFLTNIMDKQKDWIIVEVVADGTIVYNNHSQIIEVDRFSLEELGLDEVEVNNQDEIIAPINSKVYYSASNEHYYAVKNHSMYWEKKKVLVHYITDITQEQMVQKNLSDLAYIDQLTGAYNRRYCMMEINRRLVEKEKFAVIMVDLNDLKYVNDHFGHGEGDFYIKHAVSKINYFTRDQDVICRLGGDEFILLLKDCTYEVASVKMEQIFEAIREECLRGYLMSISYGIVSVDENSTYTTDELINKSDERMYVFKQKFKKNEG